MTPSATAGRRKQQSYDNTRYTCIGCVRVVVSSDRRHYVVHNGKGAGFIYQSSIYVVDTVSYTSVDNRNACSTFCWWSAGRLSTVFLLSLFIALFFCLLFNIVDGVEMSTREDLLNALLFIDSTAVVSFEDIT